VPLGIFILEIIQCVLLVMHHVWCIRHSRSLPLFFMLE
jgi:hypothetical protein